MGCWFIALGSILNAACWELTMVRPLNDGLFLKYNFQVFASQNLLQTQFIIIKTKMFCRKMKRQNVPVGYKMISFNVA